MDTRDRLHKLACRTRMFADWERYPLFWDLVKEELRIAEREHLQKEIHNNKKGKSIWKEL